MTTDPDIANAILRELRTAPCEMRAASLASAAGTTADDPAFTASMADLLARGKIIQHGERYTDPHSPSLYYFA